MQLGRLDFVMSDQYGLHIVEAIRKYEESLPYCECDLGRSDAKFDDNPYEYLPRQRRTLRERACSL